MRRTKKMKRILQELKKKRNIDALINAMRSNISPILWAEWACNISKDSSVQGRSPITQKYLNDWIEGPFRRHLFAKGEEKTYTILLMDFINHTDHDKDVAIARACEILENIIEQHIKEVENEQNK